MTRAIALLFLQVPPLRGMDQVVSISPSPEPFGVDTTLYHLVLFGDVELYTKSDK